MYRLTSEQQDIVSSVAALADQHVARTPPRFDRSAAFPRQAIEALGGRGLLGLDGSGGVWRTASGAPHGGCRNRRLAQGDVRPPRWCISCTCAASRVTAAASEQDGELHGRSGRSSTSAPSRSASGARAVTFWAPVSRATSADGRRGSLNAREVVRHRRRARRRLCRLDARCRAQRGAFEHHDSISCCATTRVSKWPGPGGLGMRGNASAPMTLRRRRGWPPRRALTSPGKGFDTMLGVVLPIFQVGSAAVALGIAEAAVRATQRHLTGQRASSTWTAQLAALPDLRARLAQMRIETDRARAHLVSVLDSLDNPGPPTLLLVLEAKAAATEAAVAVTDLGMRTCGGAAFHSTLGVERSFRDARAPVVMAPTSDQAHDFIGRALCGMELFGWATPARRRRRHLRPQGLGDLGHHPRLLRRRGLSDGLAFYTNYELQVTRCSRPHRHRLELAAGVGRRAAPHRAEAAAPIAMRDTDRDRGPTSWCATRGRPDRAASTTCAAARSPSARIDSPQATLLPLGLCGAHGLEPGRDVDRAGDTTCWSASTAITSAASARPFGASSAARRTPRAVLDLNWERGRATARSIRASAIARDHRPLRPLRLHGARPSFAGNAEARWLERALFRWTTTTRRTAR